MATIEAVGAREILDSRGNPTVEVEVALDDGTVPAPRCQRRLHRCVRGGRAARRRDRYGGKGVIKAVTAVIDEIGPEIVGFEASEQRLVDTALIDLDGTPDKSRLGANAILGVSLAVAKAAADSADLPLFRYLGGPNAHLLPVPMINILNGGAHADTNVDIQEFMIAPIGAATFAEALRWGAEVYHALKSVLKSKGLATGLGDEGGFAPSLDSNRAALDLIVEAVGARGCGPAATSRSPSTRQPPSSTRTARTSSRAPQEPAEITYYEDLVADYPLVSIEDPLAEDDWEGWNALTDELETGPDRRRRPVRHQPGALQRGIDQGAANALLVKVNQIGTLTETLDAVDLAHRHGYRCMMSHRSGETEDTTIADLAVAMDCGQIKTGHRPAASASRSTTSCCASRRSSTTRRATPARRRSRGSSRTRRDDAASGRAAPRRAPPGAHRPGAVLGGRSPAGRRARRAVAATSLAQRGRPGPAAAPHSQRLAELRQQPAWADPGYIQPQARSRLQFAMPGDTVYVVVHPGQQSAIKKPPQRPPSPHASGRYLEPATVGQRAGRRQPRDATNRRYASIDGRSPRSPPSSAGRRGHPRRRAPVPVRPPGRRRDLPRLPDGTPFPTLYYLTCPRPPPRSARSSRAG